MARSYLASDLILSAKRRALLSATGSTPFSDADWYALMDEEIRTCIWPLIRGVHEDYFVRRHDITVVAGTQEYRFPRRMLGESLKAVMFRTSSNDQFRPLPRLRAEDQAAQAVGFWFEDDRIILSPNPTSAATVRLLYHLRPSYPVAATSATKCYLKSGSNLTAVTGATWPGQTDDTVDVVAGVPGLRPLEMDVQLSDVDSGPPVVFQAGWATDWDTSALSPVYVCAVEETPIPNIPAECFPLLAQQLTVLGLEGRSGYAEARDRRDKLIESTKLIFSNKDEGNDEYVQNYDAPGWGRRRSNVTQP